MTVFIISDTHFYHFGILNFRRYFASTTEMNNYIIHAWNSVVSPYDTVVHLGDFAYTKDQRLLNKITNRLNGEIMLLRGNHDNVDRLRNAGIGASSKTFVVYENLLLSHKPMTPGNKKLVNLHGHVHTQTLGGRHINACPEFVGYKPVPIQQYIKWADQILRGQQHGRN